MPKSLYRTFLLACTLMVGLAMSAVEPEPVYGPRPTLARVQISMQSFRAGLKDPYSAILRNPVLVGKSKSYKGLIHGGGYHFGWLVSFEANAKNSYGAYVGSQTKYLMYALEEGKEVVLELIGEPSPKEILEVINEPLIDTAPPLEGVKADSPFRAGIRMVPHPQGLFVAAIDPGSPNQAFLNRIIRMIEGKGGNAKELSTLLVAAIAASEGKPIRVISSNVMGADLQEGILNLYKPL